MDEGIAAEADLRWLNGNGLKYVVAGRPGRGVFDHAKATAAFETKSGSAVSVIVEPAKPETGERGCDESLLRCHFRERHAGDAGAAADIMADIMDERLRTYEDGLRRLDRRCRGPAGKLPLDFVMRRIGRLDGKYRAAGHYKVEPALEPIKGSRGGRMVLGVRFRRLPVPPTEAEPSGIRTLRTNMPATKARRIWGICARRDDILAGLRAMEPPPGPGPIPRHSERRMPGRFPITVLAHQCAAWIMSRLRSRGIRDDWKTINDCLMDVDCAMALSADSKKAERRGLLHPEIRQAREYFKALGLKRPRKPVKELR
jgi:hypothetical protein